MVEDLNHFLAGHHLLDVAVKLAERGLLRSKVPAAPATGEAHVASNEHVAGKRDERQAPVEHHQQREGAHRLDERLHRAGKAVVERLRDRVDVIGEVAHDVAVACGVKERERQPLYVGEKVPPDVEDHLLRGAHHGLRVSHGTRHANGIDARRQRHQPRKVREVPGTHGVDHRLDHVRTQQVRQAAHRDQDGHHGKARPCMAHIVQKDPQRVAHVPRARGRLSPTCHLQPPQPRRPSRRECRCLSGTHRAPGRWGLWREAPGGFPRHARGRHPG